MEPIVEKEYSDQIKDYTLDELKSIAMGIDREKYPDRFALVNERIGKLISLGETSNVIQDEVGFRSSSFRNRIRGYFTFVMSLILIGLSINFGISLLTKKSDLVLVEGKIGSSILDSSKSNSRSFSTHYSYYLKIRIDGYPNQYRYYDSDPKFWKMVKTTLVGSDIAIFVDRDRKIWEAKVNGSTLVTFEMTKGSTKKWFMFVLLAGVIGILFSYRTTKKGVGNLISTIRRPSI